MTEIYVTDQLVSIDGDMVQGPRPKHVQIDKS